MPAYSPRETGKKWENEQRSQPSLLAPLGRIEVATLTACWRCTCGGLPSTGYAGTWSARTSRISMFSLLRIATSALVEGSEAQSVLCLRVGRHYASSPRRRAFNTLHSLQTHW